MSRFRDKNPDYDKEWQRKNRLNPDVRSKRAEECREYYIKNRDKELERRRQYRKNNREKHSAREAVRKAVKAGKLQRLPCEICGVEITEAHHENYLKENRLNVRWLCRIHHELEHRSDRELTYEMPSNEERLRYLDNPRLYFTSSKDVKIILNQEQKRRDEQSKD